MIVNITKNKLKNSSRKEKQIKQINTRLVEASNCSQEELFLKYQTSQNGFQDEERIEVAREEYGLNKITKKGADNVWKRLFRSFFNFFNIILFALAIVSMIIDLILPASKGKKITWIDGMTVIIVLFMVFLSGIIHFVQEQRGASSADKLVETVETTSLVQRNGIMKEIPMDEIVVGDIVYLAAGDIIPADVRILEAKDLFISQSSLTGESDAIEKYKNIDSSKEFEAITDRSNLAFMGTNVISGSAKTIVIATGNDTIIGQVASKINEKPIPTNFDKGIKKISIMFTIIMAVIVPIVFLILGIKGVIGGENQWLEGFLFGISIAVGLTPEMLPMIVTASLSKGAVSLGKAKTIIKNINSIQNFGSMDILCTDKTGTLTQDEVIMERHMDVTGKEDFHVLKYAFINSYYQTGLKNLLDKSIINKTFEMASKNKELEDFQRFYEKIDEIPFDFKRKRMSVLVKSLKQNKVTLITKGAVEEIVSVCKNIYIDGEVKPLDKKTIDKVLRRVEEFNSEGLRVIAIASKKSTINAVGKISVNDECDMTLIGYLTFLDPPKDSAAAAIEKLHEYGVDVKILTGDSALVTKAVCAQVGIKNNRILLGKEVEELSDAELKIEVEKVQIFAKLSPDQKARIISILRDNGHVVGYMGDGINDAPAMKSADVSISVDTAVDIAKESANIILLEKDLNVLAKGIVEGRKTHANINKYIKMTASSNFGNIFSILIASFLIPFVPLNPVQIILLNLVYDVCCATMPWDNVDPEFILKPRQWEYKSIWRFMFWFGPTSSIVDIVSYVVLFFAIIPNASFMTSKGDWVQIGSYKSFASLKDELSIEKQKAFKELFWAGWLVVSMYTQTLVIHFLRTDKTPFIKSNATTSLFISTLIGCAIINAVPYIPGINKGLSLMPLPGIYYAWLVLFLGIYVLLVVSVKSIYKRIYKEFL
ncbi:magnesium-translocating P-type ATPase [Metamycoplasma hominis]|uniref:magnesium-translocating P-type ATPase n=1 Tax=Metamycoplasma hominis TaxID=2098 RepID=UPI0005CD071B|nr:magnesium-translocating P-type ATPase [Metamycoplasma hominis]